MSSGCAAPIARADSTPSCAPTWFALEVEKTGKSQGYYSRLSIAGTIARHYAIIGDRENALTWLEEAARRRDDGPLAMRTMWYWQPYKEEPRFKAIEKMVGMP